MKFTILILLALLALVPSAFSQTPTPPFDALKVLTKPAATPTPTLASKQAQYKARVRGMSSVAMTSLAAQYKAILALTQSDDSATGGLTPAQKLAAMTTGENTELLTNAWLIANLLNGIAAGTVPNPPTP